MAAYPTEKRTDSFSFLNARCDLFSLISPFGGYGTFNLAKDRKQALMTECPAGKAPGAPMAASPVISPNEIKQMNYHPGPLKMNQWSGRHPSALCLEPPKAPGSNGVLHAHFLPKFYIFAYPEG